MAYVKTSNGRVEKFPYTIGQFRLDHSNTSFPRRIPETALAEFGVYPVTVSPAPEFDEKNYNASQNTEPTNKNGSWVLDWTVSEKTTEEKELYRTQVAFSVRQKRNTLLAETDWTGLSDVTMSQEMATYRQQLRDITNQAGFPFNVEFPVKPSE